MLISFDSRKRVATWRERGLDFLDAEHVFDGPTFEFEDLRHDDGEARTICFGLLQARWVVVGYTQRGEVRHIFSMRKANAREQERIKKLLGL